MTAPVTCTTCGTECGPDARFCHSCGARLGEAPPKEETRKVVTVLFSDVTGSTQMSEELDPESLRRMMSRYFEEMEAVLERHGGVVEKFIGDAIMAVFGVPRANEDDALRAVRAAGGMREALDRLNDDLKRSYGATITTRTGVNTGEVVAGDPGQGHAFVLGSAVNMAARLEQHAGPGEILIGEVTHQLVYDAVVAEPVGPLTVKGAKEPISAWRLEAVAPRAAGWTRRHDSPLVGRHEELARLEAVFRRASEGRACELVTVVGPAGTGKSRLTDEFLSRVAPDASALTGGCLPYGDGITFWPVGEVLREAAGIGERDSPSEAGPKLAELVRGSEDAALLEERLGELLGLGPTRAGIQETFWAVRKLFEQMAAKRPLIVVFDDIHWAEPTLLDLIEYLADSIRDAPVMLLCPARGELLDIRPEWAGGRENATLVTLERLGVTETEELIQYLVGGTELVDEARAQLVEVAEGNPLFVEQMLRMLVDDGVLRQDERGLVVDGDLADISIPPTIHALLTARLDRLEEHERALVGRAAIVGRVFWWNAVRELWPAEARHTLTSHLQSVMRKELIHPDDSEIGEEDAFRFVHGLLWDAAYNALPKSARAELHERVTDWLQEKARNGTGEFEEILGYHLERAHDLLLELGPITEHVRSLGTRAGGLLAAAGRRAYVRGDMPAAVSLFSRALELLPEDRSERVDLLPQLAFALMEIGDFPRFMGVAAQTREAADSSGDAGLDASATILELWIRFFTEPEGWADIAEREATRAVAAFQELGDERGLAKAWSLLAVMHLVRAQFRASQEAWEQAARHAERAGDRREELESLSWMPLTIWAGPAPADDGIERCRQLLARTDGDRKGMASALFAEGTFVAGLGRFGDARELLGQARHLLEEVALTVWIAGPLAQLTGWVELLAGDPAAAERELRPAHQRLTELGELAWLSTVAGILAEAIYAQGRYDEADGFAQIAQETAGTEDVYSNVLWRSARAKVLARRGAGDEAERLAHESVALGEPTDFLHLRWHALLGEAEVLRLLGRPSGAEPLLREAIRLAEQKGNIVAAQLAQTDLATLEASDAAGGRARAQFEDGA